MTVSSSRPRLHLSSHSHRVRELQRSINRLCKQLDIDDSVSVLVDGVLGPETRTAIKYLQCLCGMSATGRPETAILDFIEFGPEALSVLTRSAQGSAVLAIQQVLMQADKRVLPDGRYGPVTEQAVLAFQRRFRLPKTGIVGPRTWVKILQLRSRTVPCAALCPALYR